MLAVVGVLVFTQYWYWFPLAHCLALAFTPTCLIALNAQLKVSTCLPSKDGRGYDSCGVFVKQK
jgi:hypothetical protein